MLTYNDIFKAETIEQIVLVFNAAFYLTVCLFGYKCIKAFVAISGFFVGFVLGFAVTLKLYAADAYMPTVVGIIAGLVLAFLAFRLYLAGVFILCGSLAATAVSKIPFASDGSQDIIKAVLCIAAFIVVGIIAVKFAKLCIILVTAIGGSINAINTIATPVAILSDNLIVKIGVIAALAAIGIIVQKMNTRHSS